jgi:mRNA-degrading endonuclease RelE of RelBE toxin-antitoxin system
VPYQPVAYNALVWFIETPVFSHQLSRVLSDDEYRALQTALILRPEQGALIQGSGGLRKIRWMLRGKGKRGGLRVIYYWDLKVDVVYLLFLYSKGRQEDLTPDQSKLLRRIVQEALK